MEQRTKRLGSAQVKDEPLIVVSRTAGTARSSGSNVGAARPYVASAPPTPCWPPSWLQLRYSEQTTRLTTLGLLRLADVQVGDSPSGPQRCLSEACPGAGVRGRQADQESACRLEGHPEGFRCSRLARRRVAS